MDRYQRVEKARQDTPINENEIRITTQGKMRNYITYAISTLQDKGTPEIVLKAMGRAINKTVNIAEIIKRRVAGLHQDTSIGSTDITDTWEPLEEGLVPLEQVRHVSMITIVLSVKELDATSTGYQPPLPPELVKPMADFNEEREGSPQGVRGRVRGRGRWRGYGRGQGRGRGRGNFESGGEFNGFDGGYARGRGRGWGRGNRGFGFRGRGRGFGGGADMPPDVVGYDDVNAAPVEDFSFGRGRVRGRNRGRGRGRGRGQGRGFQGGV